jgi:RHH-type proline utilization regulon transcriptional repressor/proline dehydrogenase/delta 1-pyrroline-5-carboxylate dehydrogenase
MDDIAMLDREVFGPVLHVVRFRRAKLDALIERINETGYALTFGLHTRMDETMARVSTRIRAGNVYINRNVIGAVVGVQPFGGGGLSGTGPKAGGPLALGRLVRSCPETGIVGAPECPLMTELSRWLEERGELDLAKKARFAAARTPLGYSVEMPGPVGERNIYALRPRGSVLLLPATREGLITQLIAVLATGNTPTVVSTGVSSSALAAEAALLPPTVVKAVHWKEAIPVGEPFAAALVEQPDQALLLELAARPGPIPLVQSPGESGEYRLDWLIEEVTTSINTTAAGGNASLMSLV